MRTDTVSPLRQRMIEDMNARKLGSHTQRSHIWLQAIRRVSQVLSRHGDGRGHSPVPAAAFADECEHLQPQPHHDWAAVLVSRDAAATGSCRRDPSHPRAPEDSSAGVDLMIVAGDTGEGVLRSFEHLRRIVPLHIPIVMVMGNHEYYRRFIPDELMLARSQAPTFNVHVVENDTVTFGSGAVAQGGLRLLGATLWTDYRIFGEANQPAVMNTCASGMNDHRLIRWQKRA